MAGSQSSMSTEKACGVPKSKQWMSRPPAFEGVEVLVAIDKRKEDLGSVKGAQRVEGRSDTIAEMKRRRDDRIAFLMLGCSVVDLANGRIASRDHEYLS